MGGAHGVQRTTLRRFGIAIGTAGVLAGSALAALGGIPGQGNSQHDPLMGGVHWARGAKPTLHRSGSPNVLYHGGPVMHGTYVQPVFWGPSWSNQTFVADKVTGLESFYEGVGDTSYADTTTEYTDASGAVTTGVSYGGSYTDLSAAPSNGNQTTTFLAEVCRLAGNTAVSNGYYPVYVDSPRGHSGYCAWHSSGKCPNGVTVQFGFFYNMDNDAGCDPQDSSGLHSEGLAALANTSGHELSETLTDRHLNAWYDASGNENADKCAWTFGTPLLMFLNRTEWKIQGNWSNAAFNGSTGYPNSDGQRGCIDGGNYK